MIKMLNFDREIATSFATLVKSDFHRDPNATPGIVLNGYQIDHIANMNERCQPDAGENHKILINYYRLSAYNAESKTINELSNKIFDDVIKQI
jgi:hypothetical protein